MISVGGAGDDVCETWKTNVYDDGGGGDSGSGGGDGVEERE